jgi:hypothetical protein
MFCKNISTIVLEIWDPVDVDCFQMKNNFAEEWFPVM